MKSSGVLDEFLGLCGFDPIEMKENRPRIERTFAKIGINDTDIDHACHRIKEFFDVRLEGVRKLLGCHLLTLVELVLAREDGKKKIIYSEWPLSVPIMIAIRRANPENLVTTPAMICNVVLGQMFGKLHPVTEAGEELGQMAGQAHCPLYQTHIGSIVKGIAPVPDLEIVSGLLCEPPGASMHILHELYNVPALFVDGCVDGDWGQWPRPSFRQIEYLGQEIDRCLRRVGEMIGCGITEEIQKQAFKECSKTTFFFQTMLDLIARNDPQPISQVDAGLALWIINTPVGPELMERVLQGFEILQNEVKDRVEKGEGILPKGAPRVYVSIAVAADPGIMKGFEHAGMSVPSSFMIWQPPVARFKLPYTSFCDRTAGFGQRVGIACSTYGAIEQVLEGQRELHLDAAIMCFATSCRLYSMSPIMTKKALQKEFGEDFPVMVIEGEFYDTRNYSAEQMRTRVETFARMLKERKADQAGLTS